MTILHLSAVKNWGGGENHIENLVYELSKAEPESTNIILCRKNGKFHQHLKSQKFLFETAPLANNFDPRYIIKIIRICKKYQVDLIHIHDPRAMFSAVAADHFYDLPVFVFSKKISFPVKKRRQTLFKYNYPKIKKILCVSDQTRRVMADAIKDQEKLVTIYHGTRLDTKSAATPFLLRKELGIPNSHKIIGNISNHHKAKNLESFIDVVDTIINGHDRKDFHFVQIGTFTNRTEALIEKMEELNLGPYISFLGFTPNASNFIPQFDISLITSSNEGLPQVIYESFFYNIPVVSTNVAGIPEAVVHMENGLLANVNDHEKLSEHILYLCEHPEGVNKFTELSNQKLHENFTTKIMALNTFKIYREAVYAESGVNPRIKAKLKTNA